jgi:hypothetical protein
MAAATPEVTVTLDEDDPYLGLVDARIALNLASVPASQRFLAVGANVEAAILKSDRLSKFDTSGSSEALREAIIGRIAGFTAVTAIGLDPDIAIAAHRTAFPLALVRPTCPPAHRGARSARTAGCSSARCATTTRPGRPVPSTGSSPTRSWAPASRSTPAPSTRTAVRAVGRR